MVEFELDSVTSSQSFSLTPDDFNSFFRDIPQNSFSVSHINIRSLSKNIDRLNLFYTTLLDHDFSIIAVSEIWQISGNDMFQLDGYNFEYI